MSVTRETAVINESIELKARFKYDDIPVLFDPFEISKVEIIDADSGNILETILPPNITKVIGILTGVFEVFTSPTWNTVSRLVYDRWTFKKQSGGQDYSASNPCFIFPLTPTITPSTSQLPTPTDCRNFLEGYNISSSIISDDWIQDDIDNMVVPFIQDQARTNLTQITTATEYLSGISWDYIMLSRRDPTMILTSVQLVSGEDVSGTINLADLQLIPEAGIIKVKSGLSEYYEYRTFPKGNLNIKVQYTYGGNPSSELLRAVKLLECVNMLTQIEGRTGGGNLTVQQFSRDYGNLGKYSNIRKQLYKQAMYIVRKYGSSIIGN